MTSGVSKLQRLVGPRVLHDEIILDAPKPHINKKLWLHETSL